MFGLGALEPSALPVEVVTSMVVEKLVVVVAVVSVIAAARTTLQAITYAADSNRSLLAMIDVPLSVVVVAAVDADDDDDADGVDDDDADADDDDETLATGNWALRTTTSGHQQN